MTEWKIVSCPGATYVEVPGDCSVRFLGPDREANAALFVRAQHMGELVEALKRRETDIGILVAQIRFLEELAGESLEGEDAIIVKSIAEDQRARAILAKIGGGE